jgi:hypothetical protein
LGSAGRNYIKYWATHYPYNKLLEIKLAMLTAYHPQTNRQIECVNQVLEGYLHIFTSQQQDDWDDFLPTGEFQYNNTVHSLTQQTPFMVDTRRHPCMGFEPQQPHSTLESANKFAECMALGIEEAKPVLTKVKYEYSMYYNCQCEPTPVFALGDKVWLDGSNIATNRPLSKLSHQYLGPFVVKACVGHGAYCLALPPTSATFTHLPCGCLQHFWIPYLVNNLPPPPTTLINGEEEYEVEAIWIAECVTTVWSAWSSSRVMTRVTINGRCIHKSMQSQR